MEPNPLFLAPVTADSEPVEDLSVVAARDQKNLSAPVYTHLFSEKP